MKRIMKKHDDIPGYCASTTEYSRRATRDVAIGGCVIGSSHPVAMQSMTDTDTNDTEACVAQIGRISAAGGKIVRLTAQGMREGRNLEAIAARVRESYPDVALVADVHFLPQVAAEAAQHVDKVRINPGNYNDKGGDFDALLSICAARGVALRIGVNHGSLSEKVVAQWGDTPQGMVISAMEFMRRCRERDFHSVVVSMKSSNTRVMVHAYRLLAAEMMREGMDYPIHLGVTEAGNGIEGRIKSAVGIGALLADGIGDTIRVSLTEPPENEIPVAQKLVGYFIRDSRPGSENRNTDSGLPLFNPYEYSRRDTLTEGRLGGDNIPLLANELNDGERSAVEQGRVAVIEAAGSHPVGEWRQALSLMDASGDRRPVILRRGYGDTDTETLAIKAAADFGVMFIDGLADGIDIVAPGVPQAVADDIALNILQASRARMSKTEYIACPGCGRTLFGLHRTLETIKSRTSHLKGLKIGVMGCIVNGPGEMADADYGYVGAAPGHISLYRGRELVRRNVPQEQALQALIELIESDGKWVEACGEPKDTAESE